jgi:hypothetical protein
MNKPNLVQQVNLSCKADKGDTHTLPSLTPADKSEKGLVELMVNYENCKQHFFRCSQAYHPDRAVVQRALDAYMAASTKYYAARNKQ